MTLTRRAAVVMEKKLDKDALLRKYQDMLDMRMRGKGNENTPDF